MVKKILLALAVMMGLTCCALAHEATYPDGIYRGFYYDGGIEQIAIQFEIRGGLFDAIVYRGVKYKDGSLRSSLLLPSSTKLAPN